MLIEIEYSNQKTNTYTSYNEDDNLRKDSPGSHNHIVCSVICLGFTKPLKPNDIDKDWISEWFLFVTCLCLVNSGKTRMALEICKTYIHVNVTVLENTTLGKPLDFFGNSIWSKAAWNAVMAIDQTCRLGCERTSGCSPAISSLNKVSMNIVEGYVKTAHMLSNSQ